MDDENPHQNCWLLKLFLLVGEGSDPDCEDPPNEILGLLTNLIFWWNKINLPGKNPTALEEVAMAVAGLQETVLEAPGLEELAKTVGLDSKLKWWKVSGKIV